MGLHLLKTIGKPVDLKKPVNKPFKWALLRPLLERHLQPVARNPKGFKRHATAMIDISDGLSIDLVRLCMEGRVGARIYEEKIPISFEMKTAAGYLGLDPLALALKGGEDYELLFTSPKKLSGAVCIGEVAKSGLMLVDRRGGHRPIRPEGYRHFEV
jgi:thiamine-monophosphate kinase